MSELDECIEYAESEHPFEAYDARAELAQLRATIAEQARAVEEAREVLYDVDDPDTSLSYALRAARELIDPSETDWYRWFGDQAKAIDKWLAAHPAPQADEAQ